MKKYEVLTENDNFSLGGGEGGEGGGVNCHFDTLGLTFGIYMVNVGCFTIVCRGN